MSVHNFLGKFPSMEGWIADTQSSV